MARSGEAARRSKPDHPAAGHGLRSVLTGAVLLLAAACASPGAEVRQMGRSPVGQATQPSGSLAAQGPFQPDLVLTVCSMSVSNAPRIDARRMVDGFSPLIRVNGLILAAAPVNNACVSSGFGPRFGRMHEGLDLQATPAGPVYAAAPGRIRELRRASGYGLQLVIDHGRGVFTRYAHLASYAANLREGVYVGFGQKLGLMGDTGNATAVHLHYEILRGRWGERGSYGLTPTDPLSYPPYRIAETSTTARGP